MRDGPGFCDIRGWHCHWRFRSIVERDRVFGYGHTEAGRVVTTNDRESLRRIAYGRDATAQERAAAEVALRRLDEAELVTAIAAEDEPLHSYFSAEHEDDGVIEGDVEPPSFWKRSIRAAWLIPIIIGSLILGVVGTLGATGQLLLPFGFLAPSPSPSVTSSFGQMPGDLGAADSWFSNSATASDAFPFADALYANEIQFADVRFALVGGHGWNVWVGHTPDKLCLLIADVSTSTGAANCVTREQFAAGGVSLELNGRVASWYGGEVTAAPSGS